MKRLGFFALLVLAAAPFSRAADLPAVGPAKAGAAVPLFQNLNAAQQSALDRVDLATAVVAARDALLTAAFSPTRDPAALTTRAQALANVELALAAARADAFTQLQASPNRLNPAQRSLAIRQSTAAPRGAAAPAARGTPPPAAAPARLIPPFVDRMVPAGDAGIRYMGRWEVEPTSVTTVNSGSAIRLRFSGNSLKGVFQKVTAAPQIYVTIDDGPKAMLNIDAEQIDLAPATLAAGNHTAIIEVKDVNQNSNRWTPPFASALIIWGYVLAPGASLLEQGPRAPSDVEGLPGRWTPPALRMEFYGDSITEGVRALGMVTTPDGSDGTRTYSYLTGLAFGAHITEVGFGAQAILRGGGGGVPSATEAFPFNFAGSPRDPNLPQPDVVVINQGTNDGGASPVAFEPAYLAFLRQVHAAFPRALIAAMRPFNGNQDAAVYSAVQTLHDPRIIYIDTAGWLDLTNSPDYTEQPTGLHPSLAGHAKAAEKLTAALRAAGVVSR